MSTTKGRAVPPAEESVEAPDEAAPLALPPGLSRPVTIDRPKATVGHMITIRKLGQAVDRSDNEAFEGLVGDVVDLVEALVVNATEFSATEFWPLVAEVNRQLNSKAKN